MDGINRLRAFGMRALERVRVATGQVRAGIDLGLGRNFALQEVRAGRIAQGRVNGDLFIRPGSNALFFEGRFDRELSTPPDAADEGMNRAIDFFLRSEVPCAVSRIFSEFTPLERRTAVDKMPEADQLKLFLAFTRSFVGGECGTMLMEILRPDERSALFKGLAGHEVQTLALAFHLIPFKLHNELLSALPAGKLLKLMADRTISFPHRDENLACLVQSAASDRLAALIELATPEELAELLMTRTAGPLFLDSVRPSRKGDIKKIFDAIKMVKELDMLTNELRKSLISWLMWAKADPDGEAASQEYFATLFGDK